MNYGNGIYSSHSNDERTLCENHTCFHDEIIKPSELKIKNNKLQIYSLTSKNSDKSDNKLFLEMELGSTDTNSYFSYGYENGKKLIILVLYFEKNNILHHFSFDSKLSITQIKELIIEFSLDEIKVLEELDNISFPINSINRAIRKYNLILYVAVPIILVTIYFYYFRSTGLPRPNIETQMIHSIPIVLILSIIAFLFERKRENTLISKIGKALFI